MGQNGSKKAAGARVLLPGDVEPSLYELSISTNLTGNYLFAGRVRIHVDVKSKSATQVVLHSKELHVQSCSYTGDGGVALAAVSVTHDLKDNTVKLGFGAALGEGEGVLDVEFLGLHNSAMAGFYRSAYTDRDGNKATMASSQFEPLEARRCFPCFDEPARKAKFKVTLEVDDGLTALSNMPVESDTLMDDGKRRKVVFEESVVMSTYLLAFVVGQLDFVETKSKHGVLIRVYTPPNKSEMGAFALEVAAKVLDLFDDTFDIPYPLPKLDMVAIPEFAMGAMENWGLVTYREVDLLIDSEKASGGHKQRVATVVAHELAHQWFGNLVTMKWWDGLWLNEGFATYVATYALDNLFPEWGMWEQFVTTEQAFAMRLDALVSSHPIQVPIARAEEVEEVFGASVVRLAHSVLGDTAFKAGLRSYFKTHQFSNTETVDLWRAWEEASGKPVRKIMSTWTDQMGYPVVTVLRAAWAADESSCTMELEQRWFIGDGSEHPDSKSKLWAIPLLASVGGEDETQDLGVMSERTTTVTVQVRAGERTWIKLNGHQHVPIRINYSPVAAECGDAFANAIATGEMVATDRAGMLLDCYALTKAGLVDPGELTKLLGAFKNETSSPVFSSLEDILVSLNKVVAGDAALHSKFEAFGAKIIAKPAAELGLDAKDDDGHLTRLLRATLVRLQVQFMKGDPALQKEAVARFEAFASDPEKNADQLPTDIKTAAIKIVLASTDDPAYLNKCFELIELADTNQAKKEIFLAVGHANTVALKRRVLDWCTTALPKQDFFYPMGSAASSGPEGQQLVWDYFRENFDRILDKVKDASPSLLAAAVTNSCGAFATEEKALEIEAFFKERAHMHPVPLIQRKLQQIVENTRANAMFLERITASDSFAANLE